MMRIAPRFVRQRLVGAVLALMLLDGALSGVALADAPLQSLRPVARGQVVNGQVLPSSVFMSDDGTQRVAPKPIARSVETPPAAQQRRERSAFAAPEVDPRDGVSPETYGVPREGREKRRGLLAFLRPKERTQGVEDKNRRVTAAKRQGKICGDPAIQGVKVGRVPAKLRGCGLNDAVRVQSVSDVGLSTHSVMDCTTAKALKTWIDRGMRPAVGRRGGGVAEIRVVAHYACRTRNNQKGAKISEHGRGRAIDIAGFKLRDGTEISVLTGWKKRKDSKILRKMHKAACGPFGTVLGPESNRFHRDHFHFDTARYRSGPYCR